MRDGQRASRASPENGFKFGRVIFAEHVRNASEKLLVCFPKKYDFVKTLTL